MTRARRVVALMVSLGSVACGHGRDIDDIPVPASKPMAFDPLVSYPDITWVGSLDEARARAAEEHKPMIVFVRAAWAKPSVVMDSTVWRDARVLAEAPRFIALRYDLTQEYGEKIPTALDAYAIESVPTTLIVTSDGRVTGRFAAGAAHAAEVAAAMRAAK